ncbi:MAG TPA: hypothetical protein VGJ71_00955 [Candidatus Limnocylindrales bacterium]
MDPPLGGVDTWPGETMPARTAGAATIRHVGLVALEAVLVAMIVWMATMVLAGATQSGGLVGEAAAGRGAGALTVDTSAAGTVSVTVPDGQAGDAPWVHVSCQAGSTEVASGWQQLDADRTVSVAITSPVRPADCVAEQGYFTAKGKWRVIASTTFRLGG